MSFARNKEFVYSRVVVKQDIVRDYSTVDMSMTPSPADLGTVGESTALQLSKGINIVTTEDASEDGTVFEINVPSASSVGEELLKLYPGIDRTTYGNGLAFKFTLINQSETNSVKIVGNDYVDVAVGGIAAGSSGTFVVFVEYTESRFVDDYENTDDGWNLQMYRV